MLRESLEDSLIRTNMMIVYCQVQYFLYVCHVACTHAGNQSDS
jgi:hypothetical protein